MHRNSRAAVPGRRPGIDALRGIAALAVCLFHWEHIALGTPVNAEVFRFGLLGVELFFMISGFVIMLVARRGEPAATFLLARAVRLYPAYLASVLLTALYVLPTGKFGAGTVLVNATMLQSLVGVPVITNPYWTLAFEVTFYSAVAALVAGRAFRHVERAALTWLAIAGIYRLIGPEPLGFDDVHPLAQLGYIVAAPQFAPFFVIGAMIYRLRNREIGRCGGLALGAALALTSLGRRDFADISGGVYVTVSLSMAAALYAAASVPGLRGPGVVLARVGQISYPLYLVHCTVANICVLMFSRVGGGPAGAVLVSIPLAFLLAILIHRVLERPLQAAFRRKEAADPIASQSESEAEHPAVRSLEISTGRA